MRTRGFFGVVGNKGDLAALYGYAPIEFGDVPLDVLLEFAEAVGGLAIWSAAVPRIEDESPTAREWFEAKTAELDEAHAVFVTSLRQETKLEAWSNALLTELIARRQRLGPQDASMIHEAERQVQQLLDYVPSSPRRYGRPE